MKKLGYVWKACCTWGDGPDVLMFKEADGESFKWYDLTAKEAETLANELLLAAKFAKEMDESVREYFLTEERKEPNKPKNLKRRY